MTQTDGNSHIYLTEFRKAAFKEILNIHKKIPNYSRSSQFLAISILDKYVELQMKKSKFFSSLLEDTYICAMTCLFLSSKFNGTDQPILQKCGEREKLFEKREEIKQKILELEGTILEAIGFEVPLETPLTHLQFAIKHDNEGNCSSRKLLIKCLKTMLLSLQIENNLSKTPIIGRQIYQLLKSGSGTRRALQIYRNVRKIQAQQKR